MLESRVISPPPASHFRDEFAPDCLLQRRVYKLSVPSEHHPPERNAASPLECFVVIAEYLPGKAAYEVTISGRSNSEAADQFKPSPAGVSAQCHPRSNPWVQSNSSGE